MPLERNNYKNLGLPVGPYTHAVVHGKTLYTSGFTAFGTDAQTGSAAAQTKAVLNQLEFIAEQNGKTMSDVIKVTVFVNNPEDIPGIRSVLSDRYGTAVPASSLVMISSLFAPELRVEIEAIFAL
ncbi:MAG: RidA family protein [Roseibium sp.]